MSIEAGAIINQRYEVIGMLAVGGMGELYTVRDLHLNGVIRVLKMLKHVSESSIEQQTIAREAKLLIHLKHRALPQIFDYNICAIRQTPFIVMEWIDGIHLGQWLKQNSKSISLSFIYYVAMEVLDALSYLHAQHPPIIHRDLKPSNIMLSRDGAVKLIDFGISKQTYATLQAETLTDETIAFGTKGYAAPEQILGKGTDERTDIYSFGAVLLAMLGIEPKTVVNGMDNSIQLRNRFSALHATLNFSVPKPLRELIIDCMQEQAEHRPQHIFELKQRLRELSQQHQIAITNLEREQVKQIIKSNCSSFSQHRGKAIAVLSAHPGAGSTLLALSIASWYEQQKMNFSYIEHRIKDAELFYSLQVSNSWDTTYHYQEQAMGHYMAEEEHSLEKGFICTAGKIGSYFIASPLMKQSTEQRFMLTSQLILQSTLQRDVIIDYSSHWDVLQLPAIVQQADYLVIVNSPWFIRQAPLFMSKLAALLQLAEQNKCSLMWVSNRDQSFRGRKEWLRLHGQLDHLIIPELNPKSLLLDLWEGTNFPPYQSTRKALYKYLMPLIKKVIRLH